MVKKGYQLTKAGEHFMIQREEAEGRTVTLFALNETGAFLWERLILGKSEEALFQSLKQEYEAEPDEEEEIRQDIRDFLSQLSRMGVLEQ